jgi:cytochrome c oxidase subunit 3
MASFTSTAAVDASRISLADDGIAPPARGGGDDGMFDDGSAYFDMRLRRARLGLVVGLTGIVMIFISFTSAYVVRQGLPTLDPRTDTLVHDWYSVRLPGLLLVNTCVLLVSSITMELARRQSARASALTQVESIPGSSLEHASKFPWLALTVVLGLGFLGGQWMAWRELAANGFYVATSPSSSFVYLLTGMHGLHLLGGVLALLAVSAASLLGRPPGSRVIALDVTGWYWHSMALLWVYILCLLEFVG